SRLRSERTNARDHQRTACTREVELLQLLVLAGRHRLMRAEQRRDREEVLGVGTVLRLPVLEHPVEGIELARPRTRAQPQLVAISTMRRAWSRRANFWILPVGVIGSSFPISTRSGISST